MNKKKWILLLTFSTIVIASIPISVGTYFLAKNKKAYKNINSVFTKNNILPSVNINGDIWGKVEKNIFEDKTEIYFKEKTLNTTLSSIYNNVLFTKKHDKNHDFTNLKVFLQDMNIRSLNLNDLYFLYKLFEVLNMNLDKSEIETKLKKHWDSNNSLFFKDDINDSYLVKLVITYIWVDYLNENNNVFLNKIKKNIENTVNSNSFFDKNNSVYSEHRNHFFLLSSALKIDISTNLEEFRDYYSNFKNKILKIDSSNTIKFITEATFFLMVTDNYFSSENRSIKNKLIEIFNAANEKQIEEFIKQDIDFLVFQYIDIKKIFDDFFFKFSEILKKFTNNFENFFSFRPNVEKTFYYLLMFNESEIKKKREKIINFLDHYDRFLDYLVSQENISEWVNNVLYSEKIRLLINYKKSEKNRIKLERSIENILRKRIDYKTIFNVLLIKIINCVNTITTDFYDLVKEIIMSYKQLKAEDKNNVTVYIYVLDKILDINLIEEKELEISLKWFFKNKEKLTYANKEAIYYYFLTIGIIGNTDIQKNIKQLLKENRQKILNSKNDEEKMFFIDSILQSYFSNVIERNNNDTN